MAEPVNRILIVDDEPDIVENIAEYFARKGYEVEMAGDGHEALERLSADSSILIVVADIRMPRLDGLELLRQIRTSMARDEIKVIFISGHGGEAEADRALQLGAFRFLGKPLKLKDLQATVDQARQALMTAAQ